MSPSPNRFRRIRDNHVLKNREGPPYVQFTFEVVPREDAVVFELAGYRLADAWELYLDDRWEEGNERMRRALEALLDDIADELFGSDSCDFPPGPDRRQLLEQRSFFSAELSQWIRPFFEPVAMDDMPSALSTRELCWMRIRLSESIWNAVLARYRELSRRSTRRAID